MGKLYLYVYIYIHTHRKVYEVWYCYLYASYYILTTLTRWTPWGTIYMEISLPFTSSENQHITTHLNFNTLDVDAPIPHLFNLLWTKLLHKCPCGMIFSVCLVAVYNLMPWLLWESHIVLNNDHTCQAKGEAADLDSLLFQTRVRYIPTHTSLVLFDTRGRHQWTSV